jgi:hypothetical protein
MSSLPRWQSAQNLGWSKQIMFLNIHRFEISYREKNENMRCSQSNIQQANTTVVGTTLFQIYPQKTHQKYGPSYNS